MSTEAMKLAKAWFERNTYGDEAVDVYEALCEALAQPQQEPVAKMGMYEHKCPDVTGHRGPSFVCQKAGHGVGQNSYCNVCTCPEALNTSPLPAQRKPLTDAEINDLCPRFEDPMRREMWITGFKAAHNIRS